MKRNDGRWTAELDGDFVVFIIGAAVRNPFKAPRRGRCSARCRRCWLI